MVRLADIRKNYDRGELEEHLAHDAPLQQFDKWMQQAVDIGIDEPTAMTLATVGPDSRPSSRVVLLKGSDERGLVWFTNYDSRKGRELAVNPYAALQFHWVALERVVRIEGTVSKVDDAESDAYYATRPLASRIGAWASDQSQPVPSRAALAVKAAQIGLKYGLEPPRPPHWGGYRLVPDYWEFWQGRPSRLHDRLAYRLQPDGNWLRDRLAP